MEMIVVGGIAYFDERHLEMVTNLGNKWYIDKDGYCRLTLKGGKPIKLHRLIWETMGNTGPCSFANGNRADCRSENLIPYINGSHRILADPEVKDLPMGVYKSGGKYRSIAWGRDKDNYRWSKPCGSHRTVEQAIEARENEISKRRFKDDTGDEEIQ